MIEILQLTEQDYPIISKWWEEYHHSPFMPQSCLPDNGTGGLMIYKDKNPIGCGFVYRTNSSIAWVEYVVFNKSYRGEDRNDLLLELIKQLEYFAKINGSTVCFTTTASESLIDKYKQNGWNGDEQPSYEFIKIIA